MPRKILSIKLWTSLLLALFAFGSHAEQASLPIVGDALCGFRVTQIVHIAQHGLDFVHMEHEQTGALLVYIPCEDIGHSFSPAENDKGIPHVCEHITLAARRSIPLPRWTTPCCTRPTTAISTRSRRFPTRPASPLRRVHRRRPRRDPADKPACLKDLRTAK